MQASEYIEKVWGNIPLDLNAISSEAWLLAKSIFTLGFLKMTFTSFIGLYVILRTSRKISNTLKTKGGKSFKKKLKG